MTPHPRLTLIVRIVIPVLASACTSAPTDRTGDTEAPKGVPPSFVGTPWMSTDPSAALGALRIFLADGTLVMDSCGETYRLARWQSADDARITWEEDGVRIDADFVQATPDTLQLRLHLVDGVRQETYRRADVPFVCPDSRPNPAPPTAP